MVDFDDSRQPVKKLSFSKTSIINRKFFWKNFTEKIHNFFGYFLKFLIKNRKNRKTINFGRSFISTGRSVKKWPFYQPNLVVFHRTKLVSLNKLLFIMPGSGVIEGGVKFRHPPIPISHVHLYTNGLASPLITSNGNNSSFLKEAPLLWFSLMNSDARFLHANVFPLDEL